MFHSNQARRFGAALLSVSLVAPAQALIKADEEGVPNSREFLGYAYDQKTGALLYTERHQQEYQGTRLVRGTVVYDNPQGELIARKTLDYSANAYAPKFRTEDLRTGGIEAGEFRNGEYTVSFRASQRSEQHTRGLGEQKRLVADAGFDTYVRARMHELLKGDDVHFNFVVPSRLESVNFRAAPMGVERRDGRELLRIRIETDNALLRLFVSPGFIVYDVSTGELLEYVGLSNLDDSDANKYRVRILYPHGQKPATAQDPAPSTAGGS
ncbi:MAG: hypothetical protein ACRETN_06865 [Nevskiales bacterium]